MDTVTINRSEIKRITVAPKDNPSSSPVPKQPVPNPGMLVVAGLLPKALKPVDVPKPVEAILVLPKPPNRLGADVVVVDVPKPPKPPKLKVDVVGAAPNPPKPVLVEAGVLPKVEVVPKPVLVEDAGVLPKAGAEPKALADVVPNVGADPKPLVDVLPNAVAVGVPNPVPVPKPVVCVDGVPNRLGVDVVGVLKPNDGVPKPATFVENSEQISHLNGKSAKSKVPRTFYQCTK